MGQWTMENERLTVTVDDFGGELVSIYDKAFQREVIWQADPAFWKRHAPILFPNVGKYEGGGFRYQGHFYSEGQHGFARDRMMERVAAGPDSVTHRLVSDAETKARYPFDFVLEITHRLEAQAVRVEWTVKNSGANTLYFTIGGHPAFNIPVLPDTKYSDYYLQFDESKDSLDYLLVDLSTGTAVTEKSYKLPLTDHRYRLDTHMFDKDALIFDGGQIERAGIALPDGKPYLWLVCEEFPNFGIWSVPGAPYICLEPWCGRCDDRGFKGELSEKPGINRLDSGDQFQKNYSIHLA